MCLEEAANVTDGPCMMREGDGGGLLVFHCSTEYLHCRSIYMFELSTEKN